MTIAQALQFTILRAARAHGTHHQLALDALGHLTLPAADQWRRLVFKHIGVYLEGSKAPDNEFKDFQNHVLHPRDDYWGGAPEKAAVWYADLVTSLRKQDWPAAVYCAGVLSHYCVDPIQPLHTQQSDAENNIHAAVEHTISRSYSKLLALGEREYGHLKIARPEGDDWLGVLIRQGADKANLHYETLLAHYDITRGVVTPEDGFDYVGQRAIAEMLSHAARMFGLVFDVALIESQAVAPDVSLIADVCGAVVDMPRSRWRKRGLDAESLRVVEAMYDELKATGQVSKTMPADEQMVRALYDKEVVEKRRAAMAAKVVPFNPSVEALARAEVQRSIAALDGRRIGNGIVVPMEPPRPAPRRVVEPPARVRQDLLEQLEVEAQAAVDAVIASTATLAAPIATAPIDALPAAEALSVFVPNVAPAAALVPAVSVPSIRPSRAETAVPVTLAAASPRLSGKGERIYLTTEADIVDAPSIGPKSTLRFNEVGIDTVGDFLKAHPIALAARLEMSGVTAEVLTAWQDQARMVCTIPGLRGTHAQLLVGAGFATADAVAAAEPDTLCAAVLRYATGAEGQRVLRDGTPPDIEKIKTWLANARAVKAA
jgi:hypothetical protein